MGFEDKETPGRRRTRAAIRGDVYTPPAKKERKAATPGSEWSRCLLSSLSGTIAITCAMIVGYDFSSVSYFHLFFFFFQFFPALCYVGGRRGRPPKKTEEKKEEEPAAEEEEKNEEEEEKVEKEKPAEDEEAAEEASADGEADAEEKTE